MTKHAHCTSSARIRSRYLFLRFQAAWIQCIHLSSSSISLSAYLVPSLADAGQATSTSHLLGALHRSNRQGGVRGNEREPTGPSNPSTPSNSYHYHYRCHPNHTTHSTPVIDIFTPPIRLAVIWYGHCSLFFSLLLLSSVAQGLNVTTCC